MQFNLCEDTGFHLRVALIGPSGSGKTFTALRVATELGFERIGVIDTENKSARRYAKAFGRRFHTLELTAFGPRDYIEALHTAHRNGLEVVVIDSLSHAWMGKGGVLEMVDQSARRQARGASQNSFNGWREVTPEHNRLVEAMIQAPMHLFVTMRVKTEYVVEKDAGGKSVPRKVGLAPVQRDGLEYEFDVVADITTDHDLIVTKSRCTVLQDAVINRPGPELARTLRKWLDGTLPAVAAATRGPDPEPDLPPAEEPPAPPPRPQAAQAAPDAQELKVQTYLDHLAVVPNFDEIELLRKEMATVLKRRTKEQGERLRAAIAAAEARLKAAPPGESPYGALRDPDNH